MKVTVEIELPDNDEAPTSKTFDKVSVALDAVLRDARIKTLNMLARDPTGTIEPTFQKEIGTAFFGYPCGTVSVSRRTS